MNATTDRVRIALQKNGRLAEESLELLHRCGLHVARIGDQLLCRALAMPIDVLLVRDDDIPSFVSRGICDLGIVGENVFTENRLCQGGLDGAGATITKRLGFSKCRLTIAVPEDAREGAAITKVADLAGRTIATTYPNLLAEFLREQSIKAETLTVTGSVEVAPRLKIADAICDLVASGATLAANGLKELTTILNSEALLIRTQTPLSGMKEDIIRRLLMRIGGVLEAEDSKYIMLHCEVARLDEVIALLPGSESPTVLPLQGSKIKVAVHAVCRETIFWDTMERLKEAGASSILVLPIEKMLA